MIIKYIPFYCSMWWNRSTHWGMVIVQRQGCVLKWTSRLLQRMTDIQTMVIKTWIIGILFLQVSEITLHYKRNNWQNLFPMVNFKLLVVTAAIAKSRQSCPTLCDPIDGSPPGSHSWDFPGKNTRMGGCQFLLQCTKVKSESEVAH